MPSKSEASGWGDIKQIPPPPGSPSEGAATRSNQTEGTTNSALSAAGSFWRSDASKLSSSGFTTRSCSSLDFHGSEMA